MADRCRLAVNHSRRARTCLVLSSLALLALALSVNPALGQGGGGESVNLSFSRDLVVTWGNGTPFSQYPVDTFAGESLNVSVVVGVSFNELSANHTAVFRAGFLDPVLRDVANESAFVVGASGLARPGPVFVNLTLPATIADGSYTLRLELDVGALDPFPGSNTKDVPVIVGIRPEPSTAYTFSPGFLIASGIMLVALAGAFVSVRHAQSPRGLRQRRAMHVRVEGWAERWAHHPHRARNTLLATLVSLGALVGALAWMGFLVVPPGDVVLRRLVVGVLVGAIYALVAVGYTMVYGVLKFINFAHGEIFMWGAYAAFGLVLWGDAPFFVAVGFAVVFAAALGATIERVAYRPLRGSPRLTPLMTAIGVSLFLQGAAQFVFSTRTQVFDDAMRAMRVGDRSLHELLEANVVTVFGVPVQAMGVLILVVAVLLMYALHLFITRSRMGKAMRAVSDDFDTASVIGIHVNRVVTTTFVVGSSVAAIAGVLYGMRFALSPTMGFLPGIKAFTAAVVGGIGNVYGAFLGGFLIGLAENVGGAFLKERAFQEAIAFLILIVFLIVRPTGIMSARESEVRRK